MSDGIRSMLRAGGVIPACPLALDRRRKLDERRQRALFRYYLAAGAVGLATGVHTTQFAIRDPRVGLFEPVLTLAKEEAVRDRRDRPVMLVGGLCGPTKQAAQEAKLLGQLGYHAGLLSLAALADSDESELIAHCRAIAEIIPLFGFYLQPAVGGRSLSYRFWRRFTEITNVVAIKVAPFDRYATLDVVRAVIESGRDDIALYTGNDDQILLDLLTPFRFRSEDRWVERWIDGGLLGHWAVWTKKAVELFSRCQEQRLKRRDLSLDWLRLNNEVTDANAALFDPCHQFAGCIAGIHEVLRRQGLLEGLWLLDPNETLSPGQSEEIDRVCRDYPHLRDDAFVEQHRHQWLSG